MSTAREFARWSTGLVAARLGAGLLADSPPLPPALPQPAMLKKRATASVVNAAVRFLRLDTVKHPLRGPHEGLAVFH